MNKLLKHNRLEIISIPEIIRKKGIIEFLYTSFAMMINRLFNFFRITFLKLRGYDIHITATISRETFFFQSVKGSISLGKKSIVGYAVRIIAGFEGKIFIGKDVYIGDFSYISAQNKITISEGTYIAANVYIVDFDHLVPIEKFEYVSKPIKIGRNVWIGSHAVVLKGVTIGDHAVIGAGSVVTKDVSANSIFVGNPAKVINRNISKKY